MRSLRVDSMVVADFHGFKLCNHTDSIHNISHEPLE